MHTHSFQNHWGGGGVIPTKYAAAAIKDAFWTEMIFARFTVNPRLIISPETISLLSQSRKISSTGCNKLRPGTSLCCDTPINHPHTACCELISSLTAFHVRVCERSVWALPVCQINASSEPCPGSTASLYQTSRTVHSKWQVLHWTHARQ